jgi:hypothetical protein
MPRSRRLVLASLVAAVLALGAASAGSSANSSEQIVFSGTGSGTFSYTNSAVGFWIWCQNSNPAGAPYSGACQGAMYFYELGITTHVFGEVSELSPWNYEMDVTNGSNVSCALRNTTEVKGPHNTVTIWCSSPSGSGSSSSAVVNATGPS